MEGKGYFGGFVRIDVVHLGINSSSPVMRIDNSILFWERKYFFTGNLCPTF